MEIREIGPRRTGVALVSAGLSAAAFGGSGLLIACGVGLVIAGVCMCIRG